MAREIQAGHCWRARAVIEDHEDRNEDEERREGFGGMTNFVFLMQGSAGA